MRLKQQGLFFSCFVFRLFATVLWFKKKQSIQIIFIYINQHTNQWGFLMLVSEIKIKKKILICLFSFVFGFSFSSVFLGDGVAFLWGCFFFVGKPLLLYIVVGTCNLIKYLYIKKSRFVPFYLHSLPFHIEIYVLYIFKFNFNSMKNYNFLLPFNNLTVLVHLRFI